MAELYTESKLCPGGAHPISALEIPPEGGSTTTLTPSISPASSQELRPRAVLTVFGATLALFCTYGQMNAFGTFQTYYSSHQLHNLPSTTISWIGSLQLFAFFICGVPVGIAYDHYGPFPLLVVGSVLHVVSIIMTSFSTLYVELMLTHGALFGFGVALIFYPCLAALSTHFRKHRSAALGIAMTGSGIGGVVYPILLQHTFEKLGFGWSVRLCGAISLFLCSVACVTVTRRVNPPLVEEEKQHDDMPVRDSGFVGAALKDPTYLLLISASFFVAFGLFIPYFFITSYTKSLSNPPSLALSFYTLSVMNGGSTIGRLIPPLLADSFGCFNLLIPSTLIMALSTLTLWFLSKDMTMVLIYASVYGFASGSFIALINPCVVRISDMKVVGRRIGGLYSIIAFPALVGNPLGAIFLENFHGSYHGMVIFSGTTMFVGFILITLTRWKVARWKFIPAV